VKDEPGEDQGAGRAEGAAGSAAGGWLPPEGAAESPAGTWPPPSPPGWQQQPPGWQPPPGWHQPPPPGYYYPWAHLGPQPQEPANGPAVAGFVLGLSGLGLLVFTFGFLFIAALPCSVLAIIFGRKGKRKVQAGETRKHLGLARAGFIMGIVGTVLGVLAAAGWIAWLATLDDDFFDELDQDDDFDGFQARVAAAAIAAALRLIG
jgi:hypothetical protein